jgi:hypothetical protein
MTERKGFFLRPFGEPDPLPVLQSEWDALARKFVLPVAGARPDHARLHFLQLASELDAFQRNWAARADQHPALGERLRMAADSLRNLLEQARMAFEAGERQRVEQQQARDRQRWEQQRRDAEHQARLAQTQREIQDIYDGIRQQQRVANDRRNAAWRAVHFPETTCACGRSKMPHHLFCWDCSPGRRGW